MNYPHNRFNTEVGYYFATSDQIFWLDFLSVSATKNYEEPKKMRKIAILTV